MIIESICNMIIKLLTTLLGVLHIPSIPEDIQSSVNTNIEYMILRASEMIDLVIPYTVAKVLIGIVIAIELGVHIYHFVMWVLKKIPKLGIS